MGMLYQMEMDVKVIAGATSAGASFVVRNDAGITSARI
jgi:hypothetical protein